MSRDASLIVIGAGPAGLTAAHQALRRGLRPLVLEKSARVGGIARTEIYKDYRFDIGGHRFFSKVEAVNALWKEMLGGDLMTVDRSSRIYYRGRFFKYPIELMDTLRHLGAWESLRILGSYAQARLFPFRDEVSFEHWVVNRFGRRLYETFFKSYTEKVWGIPCTEIRAEWAAQRIRGLSLTAAVSNALFGRNGATTLIRRFLYPSLGPGMMWERFADRIVEQGGTVKLGASCLKLRRDGGRVIAVLASSDNGVTDLTADYFLSSMPLPELISSLDPPPPPDVIAAAASLSYRSFILVGLIIRANDLFPDNWIYIHSPEVKVGRIQNFGNWSPRMVARTDTSCLGMEYFCGEGDDLWRTPDADLIGLAAAEMARLGFAKADALCDGVVFRQPKAYPVYHSGYLEPLGIVRGYLAGFTNLQTMGRNGMHRYNNMDHSMLSAMMAVDNLFGHSRNLWEVNETDEYHESGLPPSNPDGA